MDQMDGMDLQDMASHLASVERGLLAGLFGVIEQFVEPDGSLRTDEHGNLPVFVCADTAIADVVYGMRSLRAAMLNLGLPIYSAQRQSVVDGLVAAGEP